MATPTRIWTEAKDAKELQRRFAALPGFGAAKARIMVGVVAKHLGARPAGWETVAPDWPTLADVSTVAEREAVPGAEARLQSSACAPRQPPRHRRQRREVRRRRRPQSRWRVAGAEITVFEDGGVRIVKIGPMGPYGNNAYVVRDVAAGEALLVDMPLDEGPLLEAIAAEGGVRTVIATHWHPDHWMTYDAVRAATGAPVLVGAAEIKIPEERIDGRLDDGAEVKVGAHASPCSTRPGTRPAASRCASAGAVITGDTLFDGGPGKTSATRRPRDHHREHHREVAATAGGNRRAPGPRHEHDDRRQPPGVARVSAPPETRRLLRRRRVG